MAIEMVRWSDNLETGIIWQDFQHQELLEQMYSLRYAVLERGQVDQIREIIGFLDLYVKDHLGIEEKYMEMYDYPEFGSHKKQHEKFINDIEMMKLQTDNPENFLQSAQLCYELNQWFVNHVATIDKKLGEFLKEVTQE